MNESLTLSLNIETENEIHFREVGTAKQIFLCLHGYLLDGAYMLKEFGDKLGEDCLIICPNGPYLVPVKKDEKYYPKFSWYFFDPIKKNYYINYDPAAKLLASVLDHFNSRNLPVTVIGYSQGGFLAPRVANYNKNVNRVISLASIYRPDRFEIEADVDYFQINSKDDLIVDYKDAQSESLKMLEKTSKYSFNLIENVGHRIDATYHKEFQKILKK